MSDGQIFEEPRRGWPARLLDLLSRRANINVEGSVKRRERLDLTVPTDKAEALRDAVERWLAGHGVTAAVTVEELPNEKARIRAKLDDADASKLDFSTDAVQSELEDLLAAALG